MMLPTNVLLKMVSVTLYRLRQRLAYTKVRFSNVLIISCFVYKSNKKIIDWLFFCKTSPPVTGFAKLIFQQNRKKTPEKQRVQKNSTRFQYIAHRSPPQKSIDFNFNLSCEQCVAHYLPTWCFCAERCCCCRFCLPDFFCCCRVSHTQSERDK